MKYTYFIYSHQTGLTKIGLTDDPQRELDSLGMKYKHMAIGLIKGDSRSEMHDRFSQANCDGEWFRLTVKEMIEIQDEFGVENGFKPEIREEVA